SVGKNRNNIVIIDGIETMNKESANAMLKTLEEPPSGTILILLTERVHSVLPTIVSRCQLLRFSPIPPPNIKESLISYFSISSDDPRLESIIHTGSISLSRFLYENIDSKVLQDAIEYWRLIEEGEWLKIFEKIDEFSKVSDIARHENLFIFLLHSLRNGFLESIDGGKNYILGNTSIETNLWKEKEEKYKHIDKIIHLCEKAISQIRSRVNISLIFFNFANSIMELNNGE
ncbi:MAG: hypothetical protein N2053_01150, partial [Chitinispirillaceae bacterium]|nr:hypothetical protein [Chitinispirillaceae bacterium]